MIAARIAPTWMIAVNAVGPGPVICIPMSFSVIVRWPVEETGRNSVSPSTMPRTMACHSTITRYSPTPDRSNASATPRSAATPSSTSPTNSDTASVVTPAAA